MFFEFDSCQRLGTVCDSTRHCTGLYWSGPQARGTHPIIFNSPIRRPAIARTLIQVGCAEAEQIANRSPKRSLSTKSEKNFRVGFSLEENVEFPFTERVYSVPDQQVDGVDLERMRSIADQLTRWNPDTNHEFPGFKQCMGSEYTVKLSASGEKIAFDANPSVGINFALGRSTDGRFTIFQVNGSENGHKIKDFGLALQGLSGTTVQEFEVDWKEDACKDWLGIWEAFEFRLFPNYLLARKVNAIATRLLTIIKTVHSVGLVHGNIRGNLVWNGKDPESIKLGFFGKAEFFVDPATGAHADIRACQIRGEKILKSPTCASRGVDMQEIAELLSEMQFFGKKVKDFVEYVSNLWYTDTPDYDLWIQTFSSRR